MKPVYLLTFVIISSIFTACKKDPPPVHDNNTNNNTPLPPVLSGVFILNEGNYTWGNASVSFYNISTGEFEEDLFNKVNNRPLGDVAHSMTVFKGKGYVVVNNSGKIEIVDPADFKSIGVINNLTSPRYFLGINNQKAYVTDLFSNAISVIDLNTNTKINVIPCPGWTEELLLIDGKVFVTNIQKNYVYVVNTINDAIEDSINVGLGSNSMVTDKNGKLWVLSGGDSNQQIPGSLHRINPGNNEVELSLTFPADHFPGELCISSTKETLYFLNKGVYKMPVTDSSLPLSAFIPENNYLFWSLSIDPSRGTIYVADAVDYVQKGWIFRYNPEDAAKIDSFRAGITPGYFLFN